MGWFTAALFIVLSLPVFGQTEAPAVAPDPNTRPARITTEELNEYESLPEDRRKLIEAALAVLNDSPWLPYLDGGAEPEAGGFDCSGAMYFVMRKAGLDPPRSSGEQFQWVKKKGLLHEVDGNALDTKDRSLAALKPGDLLFWSVIDASPTGAPVTRIHHVAMYLGTEKKDDRPVMINSTDGRSYRGQKANGYGVYDFRIQKAESLSRLEGYGTPPGIGDE
ncbi:MAG: NlpC/P60 family protein [Luteolibacter sp.]